MNDSTNQGEGNVDAARRYDDAQKRFVDAGRVDQAAADAAPANEEEATELRRAEAAGRARAKGEDPAVRAGSGGTESHSDTAKP